MSVGIEHLRGVKHSEMACDDPHSDDLAELAAEYTQHEMYLADALGQDITPNRVYMGGEIYTFGQIVIDSDEYHPAPESRGAFAAVELWAADETSVVRVSKTEDGNGGLIRRLTEDRLRWVPGMSKRRARQLSKLSSSILAVPRLSVVEFARPKQGELDDEVLCAMRTTELEDTYIEEYKTPTDQTIRGRVRTGHDPLSGRAFPDAFTVVDESKVRSFARTYGQDAHEQEPPQARMDDMERWLVHAQGYSLALAVGGLRRAVNIVEKGDIVMLSASQRDVRIYHSQDW